MIKNHEEKISFKEQLLLVSVCQAMQDVKSLKTLLLILEKLYMSLDMKRKKLQNSIRKARWYQLKSANKGVSASCSHDTSSSSSCNNVSTLETTDSETQFNSSELSDDSESSNTSALPITLQRDSNFCLGIPAK